jgi:dihydroflavonol-4-reductase
VHVALTGATGFVGAAVARVLREEGHSLRVSARSPSRLGSSLGRAEVVEGDLRDATVRERLVRGADAVVHCAAALRTSDQTLLHEVNVHATGQLASAAHAAGVTRFVLVSSTGVYGQQGGHLDEASPPRPENAYERTKQRGEEAAARELPTRALTIVRPSNVLGESHGGRPLLRLLRRLRDGAISYGRVAHTNYVHVEYVADVVRRALSPDAPQAVIVNDPLTMSEFVSTARAALGVTAARDLVVPAVASQILAALLERQRHRHPAFSRTLALVDDTRFVSRHRAWARDAVGEMDAMRQTLDRLVTTYRHENLL